VSELEIVIDDDQLTLGFAQRTMFNHWHGPPSADGLLRLEAEQRKWVERMGGNTTSVAIIDPRAGMKMSAEAREVATRLQAESDRFNIANATVVKSDNPLFRSIVRSVVAGLGLLSGGKGSKVFSEVDEAVRYVSGELVEAGHASDVDALIASAVALVERHS
jgi:hypothetical protein